MRGRGEGGGGTVLILGFLVPRGVAYRVFTASDARPLIRKICALALQAKHCYAKYNEFFRCAR